MEPLDNGADTLLYILCVAVICCCIGVLIGYGCALGY